MSGSASASEWLGRILGNYRLEQQLGAGGMGEVFLAAHIHLQRTAAIKVLHAQYAIDRSFRARFLQEARAIASLDHEHIVGVLEFGEQDDHFYLVMELLPDGSLRTLRRSYGAQAPLPLPLALDLLRQAAAGLAHAHAQGFVHRDIKPDNLLLRRDMRQPHGWLLKITDFGLVRLNDGGIYTQTGITMGTPVYMSPEQCEGIALDGRSDIYSLGIVLYEALTGRPPFEVRSLSEAVFKHVYTPPPSPLEFRPDLPPPLVDLILRCLAKRPEDRFADAHALERAIGEFISRQPTEPGHAAVGRAVAAPDARADTAAVVDIDTPAVTSTPGAVAPTPTPAPPTPAFPTVQVPLQPAMRLNASAEAGANAQSRAHDDGRDVLLTDVPPPVPPVAAAPQATTASPGFGRLPALALVGVFAVLLVAFGTWLLLRGDGSDDDGDAGDDATQVGVVATASVAPDAATGDASTAASAAVDVGTAASGAPIVFSTSRDTDDGTLDLWTMTADGQEQMPLISLPHDDWSPAWSPDGTMLAWVNKAQGNDDIWLADADGTDARQVTGDAGDDRFPTWSPDSTRILFLRTIDGTDEVFVYNLTNNVEEQLTYNSVYDGYASWSPDGTRMVWTSGQSGNDDIWLMEADTGSYALTYEEASDFSPIWAAGGEHIIFVSDRYGNQDIFVMDANGSNQQPITSATENEWYPRLSPDSTMLAFVRQAGDVAEDRGDLVVVSLTEGNEWVIANDVLAHDPGLVWSPDSSDLLFQRQAESTYVDLWWVDLSGATQQLTDFELYDGGASWRSIDP